MQRPLSRDDSVCGRLRAYVNERLTSGTWSVGARLPDSAALAEELGTDEQSVLEAIEALSLEQLIVRHRDGSVVITGCLPRAAPNSQPPGDGKSEFAQALQRFLSWASDEALEVLHDDVVAKHLAAASERISKRFKCKRA